MSEISTRVLLTIVLVVTGVGVIDAFFSREWDLLAVFALSALLQLTIWFRHRANRVPITLRPDLARWLEQETQQSGEPIDDVLDRAVAWYQHGLYSRDAA